PVRKNPKKRARTDIDFGDTAHTGTPPPFHGSLELAAHDEHVILFLRLRHRLDPEDFHRKLEFRLAGKGDFTRRGAVNFVDVLLPHAAFDIHLVCARHLKKHLALLHRRPDTLPEVALDHDAFKWSGDGGLLEAIANQSEPCAGLVGLGL